MRKTLLGLFWHPDERRLRTPWRLLVAAVVTALLSGVLIVFVYGAVLLELLRSALVPTLGAGGLQLLTLSTGAIVTTAVVFAAVAVVGRYVDRRHFRDFGFRVDRDWWIDFGFGLALGGGLMTAVFLAELAAGWASVTDFLVAGRGTFLGAFAAVLVLFVCVGIYEELLARGYLLTNLAEGLRGYLGPAGAVAVAVLVSSGLFGLVHASNPNATPRSVLGITLAGVTLALGYVLTNDLAIPVGLHVTWNFFQGVVYGFPVSGLDLEVSVVGIRQSGPAIATGGRFGPEAGLVGFGAIALGAGCIVLWVRYRYGSVRVHPGVVEPDLLDGRSTDGTDEGTAEATRAAPSVRNKRR